MSWVVVSETMRRHFTSLLVLFYLALLAILGLGSARLQGPIWPSFITLLSFGAGAGLIGPEFSTGTLQLILVKPINRAVYLVSRWAGVVAFIALAAALAFGAEATGLLLWGGSGRIEKAAILWLNVVSGAALTC